MVKDLIVSVLKHFPGRHIQESHNRFKDKVSKISIGQTVLSNRIIEDNPISDYANVNRWSEGTVEDIDFANEQLLVDFGNGAIIVSVDELVETKHLAGKHDQKTHANKDKILGLLNVAEKVKTDKRFNVSFIDDIRRDQYNAIVSYLSGEEPLAEVIDDDGFKSIIMGDGNKIYEMDDWEPIASGRWMDWPEEHWGLSEQEYNKMPRAQRATLEAKEQLKYRYQFYSDWVGIYHPDVYAQKFWDEGWSGLSETESNKRFKKLALKLRGKQYATT
jgi:hypothetical protein